MHVRYATLIEQVFGSLQQVATGPFQCPDDLVRIEIGLGAKFSSDA